MAATKRRMVKSDAADGHERAKDLCSAMTVNSCSQIYSWGRLFKLVRDRAGKGAGKVTQEQRSWIADRDQKCPISRHLVSTYEASRDAARCVSEETMKRMDALLEENGTPRNYAELLKPSAKRSKEASKWVSEFAPR